MSGAVELVNVSGSQLLLRNLSVEACDTAQVYKQMSIGITVQGEE